MHDTSHLGGVQVIVPGIDTEIRALLDLWGFKVNLDGPVRLWDFDRLRVTKWADRLTPSSASSRTLSQGGVVTNVLATQELDWLHSKRHAVSHDVHA